MYLSLTEFKQMEQATGYVNEIYEVNEWKTGW